MAQFLFISRLFLLFHSNMERNRARGGFITKLHGLSQFAVNSDRSETGLIGNLPHGLILGLKVDELLQVFGFGKGVFGAEVIASLTVSSYTN